MEDLLQSGIFHFVYRLSQLSEIPLQWNLGTQKLTFLKRAPHLKG